VNGEKKYVAINNASAEISISDLGLSDEDLKDVPSENTKVDLSIRTDTVADDGTITFSDETLKTLKEDQLTKKQDESKKAVAALKENSLLQDDGTAQYSAIYSNVEVFATFSPDPSAGGSGSGEPVNVTDLNKKMTINYPLSEDMQDKENYLVLLYHNGETYEEDATVIDDGRTLSFETDKFSTYAILYREKEPVDDILSSLKWNTPSTNSFTYDGNAKTYNATLSGYTLPEGDSVEFTYTGRSATDKGDYTVKLSAITYTSKGEKPITYRVSDLNLPKEITDGVTWTIKAASTSGGGGAAPDDDEKTKEETTEPVKTGSEVTVGGNTYLVTSTADGKTTVSFTGSKEDTAKVTIPSTVEIDGVTYEVTAVAANAFSGNKKLTTVTIPSTVTAIEKNAFKGCTSLKSIVIPKNVTAIGASAFNGCKSLKSIVIPKNVKTIGDKAFANCTKLKSITIKSTKLTKIGSKAFANIAKNAACKVPASKKKAYKKLLKKAGYSRTVK
jgi:hypothetical protein